MSGCAAGRALLAPMRRPQFAPIATAVGSSSQPPLIAAITSTRERASSAVSRCGALAVDVDVDVPAQRGARLAEAVAKSGPALLEPVERLVDGARRRRRVGAAGRRRAAAASRVGAARPRLVEDGDFDGRDPGQVARDLGPALALVGAREQLARARAEVDARARRTRRSPSPRAARPRARRCCGRSVCEPLPSSSPRRGCATRPPPRRACSARGRGRAGSRRTCRGRAGARPRRSRTPSAGLP